MLEHTFEEIKLDNGLKGLFINVPKTTVFRINLVFMAGTYLCPKGKPEIAHALEHLVLKANETYRDDDELDLEINKNGAYHNAYTSYNILEYVYKCADFEWQRILNIAIESITTPLLLEEHLKTEKEVIKEELSGYMNNPTYVLEGEIDKQQLNLDLTDATRFKLVSDITIEDCRQFYNQTHHNDNMYFIICGDLDETKTKQIKEMLNGIKFKTTTPQKMEIYQDTLQPSNSPVVINKPDVSKIYFQLNYSLNDIATKQQQADLRILGEFLCGGRTSLFSSKINSQARNLGLTYGLSANFFCENTHANFSIGGSVLDNNIEALFDIIISELNNIKYGKLTKTEVENIKRSFNGYQDCIEYNTNDLTSYYGRSYFNDRLTNPTTKDLMHYGDYPLLIKNVDEQTITDTFNHLLSFKKYNLGLLGKNAEHYKDKLYKQCNIF